VEGARAKASDSPYTRGSVSLSKWSHWWQSLWSHWKQLEIGSARDKTAKVKQNFSGSGTNRLTLSISENGLGGKLLKLSGSENGSGTRQLKLSGRGSLAACNALPRR